MSVFYKSGFLRESVLGNIHDVRGHWVSRDEWGNLNRNGISAASKIDFLIGDFRQGNKTASETKPTKCPECGDPVFFHRNECGGAVWFDALGWPWPKHPCMEVEETKCSFDYFNRQEAAERERKRLEWLAEQEAESRAQKKEQRRNSVKLWQVYGAARFYRIDYPKFWSAKFYIPKAFQLTPRPVFQARAACVGKALKHLPEQSLQTKYELSRPAKMYGPRKMKMVLEYFEAQGQSPFSFVMMDGATHFSFPLRLVRSLKSGDKFLIAAVSEVFPWVGIWLQTQVGMEHRRQRHALLEWVEGEDDEKLLSFMSFSQARLHWRYVDIVGIFDGRRIQRP